MMSMMAMIRMMTTTNNNSNRIITNAEEQRNSWRRAAAIMILCIVRVVILVQAYEQFPQYRVLLWFLFHHRLEFPSQTAARRRANNNHKQNHYHREVAQSSMMFLSTRICRGGMYWKLEIGNREGGGRRKSRWRQYRTRHDTDAREGIQFTMTDGVRWPYMCAPMIVPFVVGASALRCLLLFGGTMRSERRDGMTN